MRNNKLNIAKDELVFPELTGTPSEIKFAEEFREAFYNSFRLKNRSLKKMILNETSASFWLNIDSKIDIFIEKKQFLYQYTELHRRKERRKQIIDADAVAPEQEKYEGIVEIINFLSQIQLRFRKNEDFISLVKSKHYKWDSEDKCWYRNLTEQTGTYSDRAAEIGHELLKNGFCICIHDPDITEKAINGDYKKERSKWVKWNEKTQSLALYSLVKDESYDASRKIMDNRYNFDTQCIDIHISHYRAVNNFAKKYDFQFSEAAIAAIEQYKEEKRNMRKVKVKDV